MQSLILANEYIAQKKLTVNIKVLSNGVTYYLAYTSTFCSDIEFLSSIPVKDTTQDQLNN